MKYTIRTLAFAFIGYAGLAQGGGTIISFAHNNATAYELNLKPAILIVKRNNNAEKLLVNYSLSTNAVTDRDFSALPDKITFEPGQAEAHLIVHPLVDYKINGKDKLLQFTLLAGDRYQLTGSTTASVSIIRDLLPKGLPEDSLFFTKLDYRLPAFAELKAAVVKGDYVVAKKLLASYYRNRISPVYPYSAGTFDKNIADEALQNTYSVTGLTYNFGKGTLPGIDWSYSVEGNPNWAWEFNRMSHWNQLLQGYLLDTIANKKYAERIFYELRDWLHTSRLDATIVDQLTPGNRWRHLETGIRLEGTWTKVFDKLNGVPGLDDVLLVDWLKAFYMHVRFLEVSAELFTNRGLTEAIALFIGATYFPEFTESSNMEKLAIERIENIIEKDINSDGTFKEFSPSYHEGSVSGYRKIIAYAKLNKLTLSPLIHSSFEKLLNYLMLASEPAFTLPQMNDSYKFTVNGQLAYGASVYPTRKDFEYFGTRRQRGTPPPITSHLFADAGQAVMRSGWKADDNYLLLDGGPFGTSHGNEDKLSINVNGYSVRHIIDGGPYNYEDTNMYRKYSVSTFSKSAPLVDDMGQNRRSAKALYTKKSPVVWYSSEKYDYAAAAYGMDTLETWGKEGKRPVIVTRHIFYLKPDVWVVIDDFKALDKQPHLYTAQFQCSDDKLEIDTLNKSVSIQIKTGEFDPFNRVVSTTVQPSLTITPATPGGLAFSVIKGQTSPRISGWQFEKSTTWKKQAIPTVRYDLQATGDAQMAFVLAAAPAGKSVRKPVIQTVKTNPGTYAVKLSMGTATSILVIGLHGDNILWNNKMFKSKALIVTHINGKEKVIETGTGQ